MALRDGANRRSYKRSSRSLQTNVPLLLLVNCYAFALRLMLNRPQTLRDDHIELSEMPSDIDTVSGARRAGDRTMSGANGT